MEHNEFFLENRHLKLSDEFFITWLGPADLNTAGLAWHYSANGKLFLLESRQDGSQHFSTDENRSPTQLASIPDVANYIRRVITLAEGFGSAFEYLRSFSDAVCFAIYPGFGIGTSKSDENEDLLRVFYDNLEHWRPGEAGALLARLIFEIAKSSEQAGQYVRHCLKHMSSPFVGIVCGHGLVSRSLWNTRQQHALIEGWRYQLKNPEKIYANLPPQPGGRVSISLIERDLRPDDKLALLAATGLSESDFKAAMDLAILAKDVNDGQYTKTLLYFLGARSSLEISRKDAPDIFSLGDLID